MPDVETYGGSCPNCKKQMLQKCDSGSHSFLYDACPWCGFAYGHGAKGEYTAKEIWQAVLGHYSVKSIRTLTITLKLSDAILASGEFFPAVFRYSDVSPEEIKSRCFDLSTAF